MIKNKGNQNGFIIAWVISLMLALAFIITAALSVIYLNLGNAVRNNQSQLAFNIADAGINYYLWHLNHDSADFKDGNTSATVISSGKYAGYYGPFEHNYKDDNSNVVGKFILYVKPKTTGSTIGEIISIGKTSDGKSTRTVQADLGAPSFATYGLATAGMTWFGANEAADGKIHSNVGIRMDGASNADVTSARSTYVPSSSLGGNGSTSRSGVWCNTSVTTPVNCNTRSKTDWRYPVPTIDFAAIVGDRCELKKTAFMADPSTQTYAGGTTPCSNVPNVRTAAYIPRYNSSGAFSATTGYLIELNNNNTYNLSRVTNETYNYTSATNYTNPYTSALTRTSVATNIPIPAEGVIFVEDNLWIRSNSQFRGRATIVAARQADSNTANIIAADDIEYSTKNGQDVLGLISEGSFLIAPYAPPKPDASTSNFPFKIHAAIISGGDVRFPSSYMTRSVTEWTTSTRRMEYFGSIGMTNESGVWTWSTSSGSSTVAGFQYNTTSYDYNLLYAPPPHFPITDTYNILNWREKLTTP